MTEVSENYGDKVDRRKVRVDRPSLAEILPVEAGGVNYEFKYEPRCRVCNAGDGVLELVNRLLATGATYADVTRAVEVFNRDRPANRQISYNSIRNHQKLHMPFESQAIRQILENRAKQAEKDFINGQGTILNPASYAEVVMQKSFEDIQKGISVVETRDGLAAAKMLHAITAGAESGLEASQALAQLNKIIEAVRAVVTPEQMDQIVQRLESTQSDEMEELEEAEEYGAELPTELDD